MGQQAREVVIGGPQTQGSKEYIFQSNAPKGSLVVFRRDVYLNDKLIDRYEVISKTPAGVQFQKTVLINSGGIKVDDGNMYLPSAFTQKAVAFSSKPACVRTVFEGFGNNQTWAVTYIFTMRNEPFEDVVRRVSAADSSQMKRMEALVLVSGYTYCVDYSNTSHPMARALGFLD